VTTSIDLPRDSRAPARARAALSELAGGLGPERLHDAQLLASELVTNAVKYGEGSAVRLDLELAGDRLRVEVVDDGAGFVPRARDADPTEVGGWGLPLVEHLADRWGAYEGSTHVWFELASNAD
jgi:anti-sigma regulatory factor (Ser/Thr protein kinase)